LQKVERQRLSKIRKEAFFGAESGASENDSNHGSELGSWVEI
jgi:hypothetical protein